jgi:molecular chaperone DnaK
LRLRPARLVPRVKPQSFKHVVVGSTAKDVAEIYSDRVISAIKRSMGIPNSEQTIDGQTYRPEEISAFILGKLVKDAMVVTGDKIEDVVITCPAYFGMNEKEATRRAGEIAGLNVRYVLHEPTAAAIAYGVQHTENQNILVYDLGGGTFDVTVISVSPSGIRVITTNGDKDLGGKNWDEKIAGYFAKSFSEQTGIPAHELAADAETMQELVDDAERAKITLSSANSVKQKVRFGTESAVVELTRATFDELTRDLLERTVGLTNAVMVQAKEHHGVTRIDALLLVGGSTYMAQVIERMSQFAIPIRQVYPNQAIAKGAALYGCLSDPEWVDGRAGDEASPPAALSRDPSQGCRPTHPRSSTYRRRASASWSSSTKRPAGKR